MPVIITESGMQFGEYSEEQVFHLENSKQYRKSLMPKGIKSCEFILRCGDKLYFVEAKTSCPKQIAADSAEDKITKYEEYVRDIALKMKHSLALYSSILLNRHSSEGLSELLRQTDLSGLRIILLLVVKEAEEEWLSPLQDVLRRELKDEMKIWRTASFFAINEKMARSKRFIL